MQVLSSHLAFRYDPTVTLNAEHDGKFHIWLLVSQPQSPLSLGIKCVAATESRFQASISFVHDWSIISTTSDSHHEHRCASTMFVSYIVYFYQILTVTITKTTTTPITNGERFQLPTPSHPSLSLFSSDSLNTYPNTPSSILSSSSHYSTFLHRLSSFLLSHLKIPKIRQVHPSSSTAA